ncbi:MAG: heme anaerobic degradation radical SAM methyltransferase ChuW/HutW [Planctomycetes bacterium]|nr:heme anaerobic degradation radical SAM methyltransferase ChuW/HutW [Planctomycetota bacterium]
MVKRGFAAVFADLDEARRGWLTGWPALDPLSGAFPRKRVVHAGMGGGARPEADPAGTFVAATTAGADPPVLPDTCMAYVHIPFCRTRCTYCQFYLAPHHADVEDAYIDLLLQEFAQTERQVRRWPRPCSAVYLGGGTPSDLTPRNLERLFAGIRRHLPLRNDAEITLEGRLSGYGDDRHEVALVGGANRFSFGVQSFDTGVRRRLGRIQDGDAVAVRLTELARRRDAIIACDLIYGLPGQDRACWQRDLETLGRCAIDGVSTYQLNLFQRSPLHRAVADGRVDRPATTAEQAGYFRDAEAFFAANGFQRLQCSHFASSRMERSLYNAASKGSAWVMPFGAGAGGFWGGRMFMHYQDLAAWRTAVTEGRKPVGMAIRQSQLQERQRRIGERLENTQRLSWSWLDAVAEADARGTYGALFRGWETHALARLDTHGLELLEAGRFWVANLAQALCDAIAIECEGCIPSDLQPRAGVEIAAQG